MSIARSAWLAQDLNVIASKLRARGYTVEVWDHVEFNARKIRFDLTFQEVLFAKDMPPATLFARYTLGNDCRLVVSYSLNQSGNANPAPMFPQDDSSGGDA